MRTDVIVDIVYSAYIQDYFLYFTLITLGYFVVIYFIGYIIGSIPFIKKIFSKTNIVSVLIWLPILIGIYKVIFNVDNANYFLEQYLFMIIFLSMTALTFIYSGTKQLYSDFSFMLFTKLYKFTIITILIICFFYAKNYFTKNYNFIETELRNEVFNDLRNIKINNQSLYRIAKTMSTHYMRSTNKQLRIIDNEKERILLSFEQKMKSYDNKYENLVQLINESRTSIKLMENRYENKIDIVDSEIDNKKLKLDAEYKAWKHNVENNIGELDSLVQKSKNEMKLLDNNKIIINDFKNELAFLNKKIVDINSTISKSEEKSKNQMQLLSNDKVMINDLSSQLELLNIKLLDINNTLSQSKEKTDIHNNKIDLELKNNLSKFQKLQKEFIKFQNNYKSLENNTPKINQVQEESIQKK